MSNEETVTLYRPVGTKELALIKATGDTAFPPRLPEQPIFYPVLNEEYAAQIARDWNAKYNEDKTGYVTGFAVRKEFLDNYEIKIVGGKHTRNTGFRRKIWKNLTETLSGRLKLLPNLAAGKNCFSKNLFFKLGKHKIS